ncbi:sigma-54 interaction domain-containing protein [Alteribacillus bidgolensis]|uniref:PAS domain S-box-containing protein n=1 Tax=Alteribacillus bidgolensis TaxID=930129 RepID=A0A1G8PLP9_9BACI|nr:sigma 54-interacting transcriptional regulator [Alteribacillus bidgolensis]SDI93246.1 PAS domain S-box-containing protein [Alteribacillus bidgolensis]
MGAISSKELTLPNLLKILDYSSDEIFVLDSKKRIVYVNKVCEKHYGLEQKKVMGKFNSELYEKGYWEPSIVPEVYASKKPCYIKQQTYIGAELLTRATPILNEKNEIELVVIIATEWQSFKMVHAKNLAGNEDLSQKKLAKTQIITNSKEMNKILKFCHKIASKDSTVLILGQSGTGKGLVAKHIHDNSKRKNEPMLTINCAAIPEELLESELFGYESGAFSGANKSGKIGLFEAANRGTIFLDEIGEMSLSLQAKLLQVIQDKEYIPVGSNEIKKVDIRIIAATNQNLQELVEKKQFREDLYYRLNVIDIELPPLRSRKEDIIPLTYHFLYKFNKKYNENKVISDNCLNALIHYSWPGNIRQLENLIERLVVVSDEVIEISDLPQSVADQVEEIAQLTSHPVSLDNVLNETTRFLIRRSYKTNKSSRKVANDLNISQTKASKLIREHCGDLIDEKQ